MPIKPTLQVTGDGPPPPAFSCLVYVRSVEGGTAGRVANLAGIEVTADSERGVLQKIVPLFKQAVGGCVSDGQDIPWIDPPTPIAEGESKRILPVHL